MTRFLVPQDDGMMTTMAMAMELSNGSASNTQHSASALLKDASHTVIMTGTKNEKLQRSTWLNINRGRMPHSVRLGEER